MPGLNNLVSVRCISANHNDLTAFLSRPHPFSSGSKTACVHIICHILYMFYLMMYFNEQRDEISSYGFNSSNGWTCCPLSLCVRYCIYIYILVYLSQLTRGTLEEGNFNIIIILLALMLAFLSVLTCTFDKLNVTIMTGML